jgi:hypothetical protein
VIGSWGARSPALANDAPIGGAGAVKYALVRRGLGLRIGGGSPRAYYVGVGDAGEAVCVIPRGAGEGVDQALERDFALVLGRPVRFRLFASAGFRPERAGEVVNVDEDLAELPPLQTVVPGEGTAKVRLRAAVTEIGTLEVFCEGAQRWKLEFQLRGGSREAGGVSQLPRNIDAAREQVQQIFSKKPVHDATAKDLWRGLERVLGERASWTLATDRDLWGVLWAGAQKRRRTPTRADLLPLRYLLPPLARRSIPGASSRPALFGQASPTTRGGGLAVVDPLAPDRRGLPERRTSRA